MEKTIETGKPEKKNKQFLFLTAGIVLLLFGIGLRLHTKIDGKKAQKNADILLKEYRTEQQSQPPTDEGLKQSIQSPTDMELKQSIQSPADVELPEEKKEIDSTSILDKYPIMGILYIPKMELELPVINSFSEDLLTISPCRYKGPEDPAEYGNIVISGHNYIDGAHFGQLNKLEVNDSVVLTNLDGTMYYYNVDTIKTVSPSSIDAIASIEDGLTLFTCNAKGDKRLVLTCLRAL